MDAMIRVLHFADQCPWSQWTIEQASRAAERLHTSLEALDVSLQPELARRHRLFFPFMILIDDHLRLPVPLTAEAIVRTAQQGLRPKPAHPQKEQPSGRVDRIIPLNLDRLPEACQLCVPQGCGVSCQAKAAWVRQVVPDLPGRKLGYLAYQGDKPVAAVEILPPGQGPLPAPRM